MRYKGFKGRLVHVVRRDGGLYYIALVGQLSFSLPLGDPTYSNTIEPILSVIRLGQTIVNTPTIFSVSIRDTTAEDDHANLSPTG